MITWPDLKFPPINLWTAPRLAAQPESIKKATPKLATCRARESFGHHQETDGGALVPPRRKAGFFPAHRTVC